MDLITNYITETKKKKLTVSRFFRANFASIQAYNNHIKPEEQNLDLQAHWKDELNTFAATNTDVKVVQDFYKIDFVDYELARKVHLNKNRNKKIAVEEHIASVNNITNQSSDNIFSKNDTIIPFSNLILLDKLNQEKSKLKHEVEIHKKDLLYYSIIDLTTTNEKHAINKIFTKSQIKKYIGHYSSHFEVNKVVAENTKKVLKNINNDSLKNCLKQAKSQIRSSTDPVINRQLMKKIIKIAKVYRDALESDDIDKLDGHMNEVEYTHEFLNPIIKQILDTRLLRTRLGESHLQCAARDNNDDERAEAGPKIDIIILHKEYDMAISLCEVSSPNFKTNKSHFLGDRNKLAKNMRAILKNIEDCTPTPHISSMKKMKVFGIQVYMNALFIYSLSRVTDRYSVFLREKKISIPISRIFLFQQLPAFLGSLWCLDNMFKEMDDELKLFFDTSSKEEIQSVFSDSEQSSLEFSPRKKQRQKK